MEQLGYFGIALLMFLDNVFPPVPSEIIMPSAGFTASKGQLLLSGVIVAGSIGSLVAAAALYWIGSLYTTNFTEPLSYQDSAFLKLPKFP